jgi:flagellar motility protein MotE (MotC chaperone)
MATGRLPAYLRPPDTGDTNVYVSIETVPNQGFEQKANEVDCFLMSKWVQLWFPGTLEARPIQGGKLLVAAKSAKIAENAIKNAKKIYELCEVKVELMDSMNQAEGTVFGRELLSVSVESLEENLKDKGVIKVERIKTMRGGSVTPNGLHILTFAKKPLPETIIVGYMRYEIRQHYPRPLRCGGCCELGHSRGRCPTKIELCRDCAGFRHPGPCTAPKKCVNCEPPHDKHGSYDKNCPELVKQMAITRLKIDLDISYGLARKKFEEQVDRCQKSYAITVMEAAEKEAEQMYQNLNDTRQKHQDAEELRDRLMAENEKLGKLLEEVYRLRNHNEKLREMYAKVSTQANEFAVPTTSTSTFSQAQGTTTTTTPSVQTQNSCESSHPMDLDTTTTRQPISNRGEPNRRPRANSGDEESCAKQIAVPDIMDKPRKRSIEYEVTPDLYRDLTGGQKKKLIKYFVTMNPDTPAPVIRRLDDELTLTEATSEKQQKRAEQLRKFIMVNRKSEFQPISTDE